jgi:hypothetical protein
MEMSVSGSMRFRPNVNSAEKCRHAEKEFTGRPAWWNLPTISFAKTASHYMDSVAAKPMALAKAHLLVLGFP